MAEHNLIHGQLRTNVLGTLFLATLYVLYTLVIHLENYTEQVLMLALQINFSEQVNLHIRSDE